MVKFTVRKCFLSCRKTVQLYFSSKTNLLNQDLSCWPQAFIQKDGVRERGEGDPVEGPWAPH